MSHRGLVFGVLVSLLCGCGAHRRSLAAYEAPIGSDDVDAGHRRYQVVCAPCHEHRDERGAPSLATLGWSAAGVRRQVREGSALMPPIRPNRLSDAELEDLLAYFADIGAVIEDESPDEREAAHAPRRPSDAGVDAPDAGLDARDAGRPETMDPRAPDAGMLDATIPDAAGDAAHAAPTDAPSGAGPSIAPRDAGPSDAGPSDAGPSIAPRDAAPSDAGPSDAGPSQDVGVLDAGVPDAGVPDAGVPDAGVPDAGVLDAGVLLPGRSLGDPRR